jgi:hypothetical protein
MTGPLIVVDEASARFAPCAVKGCPDCALVLQGLGAKGSAAAATEVKDGSASKYSASAKTVVDAPAARILEAQQASERKRHAFDDELPVTVMRELSSKHAASFGLFAIVVDC